MQPDTALEPNPLRHAAILARWTTLAAFLAMFVGTHLPFQASNEIVHHDKLIHFWAYMTLSFLVLASWDLSIGGLRPIHYFLVWFAGALYGAFDELTQIPVGRSCDPVDWLFDVMGLAAGLMLFRILRPLVYRVAHLVPAFARASQ
jgi:VanZ family protein